MNPTLKIETGIPIPKLGKPRGGLVDTIKKMKDGDSVFFSREAEKNKFYAAIYNYARDHARDVKPVSRRVEGGWRVWLREKRRD